MKVELLKDVHNHDKDGNQVGIKIRARRGRGAVAFFAGSVIEMSETSAQKYIDNGWAKPVEVKEPE